MKKLILGAVGLLAIFGFSGCSETPKCGDTQTKAVVIQIIKEEFHKGGETDLNVETQYSIDNTRTSHYDKSIDKYSCEADLIMYTTYKGNPIPGESREPTLITYSSQITDDGKNFYIQVYEF